MSEADRRIAMFGGTFNPVHNAHLRAAVELRDAFELDALHMVPAHLPPHRDAPGVSSRDRFEMLRLGIDDTPGLIADDREIRRDGPSWSVETLRSLREHYGSDCRLMMVLGHDAFLGLPDWHRPRALFEQAHVVVIGRPHSDSLGNAALESLIDDRVVRSSAELMRHPAGGVLFFDATTPMSISSTDIRHRLAAGGCARYLLPPAVERYITARGFYRDGGS
ncbi:nicotinate-nucleotide adenylyltransferase [Kushneria aurantia]|uniref:Probable nicotinate-nucleotide adenylyltransferase n=1 Tax=Kushneria aurantia TaxID=504092 RepID=A0ABV6G2N0_9GAMM|nr:nicotinate-nucleotide adenylyltransferase [Kushneria aurantia]